MSESAKSQLESFFETSDLLQIVGIKNKEAYMSAPSDPFTARQAYLRTLLRGHPETLGLSPTNPEHYEEYMKRCKTLFILRDIYEFLSSENSDIVQERAKYFEQGKLPKLISLEILSDHEKCKKRFGVPPFETIAAELKEIFAVQMRRIQELQGEDAVVSGQFHT